MQFGFYEKQQAILVRFVLVMAGSVISFIPSPVLSAWHAEGVQEIITKRMIS